MHIELNYITENLEYGHVKDLMQRFVRQTNGTICNCQIVPASLELHSEPGKKRSVQFACAFYQYWCNELPIL